MLKTSEVLEVVNSNKINREKSVYIDGFGICYKINDLKCIPSDIRYYQSAEGYEIYGSNDYTFGESVVFFARKKVN